MFGSNTEDILFDEVPGVSGNLGRITLNRPQALNALTTEMCIAIDAKLKEWQHNDHIKAVVIRGEGDRAFCAGGDLRHVYEQGKFGSKQSRKFFWHEYRMNHRIFHFPKPYIALMHGVTMGGGVGVSVHGSHRVAAEDLMFAMPETRIGFFPDVGGSFFLPRFTGKTGFYLALTAEKVPVADAIYVGAVNHLVPKKDFEALTQALAESRFSDDINVQVSDLINEFSVEAPDNDQPSLVKFRTEINHCFGQETVEKILNALHELDSDWARNIMILLRKGSPTSLKVALKELQLGSHLDFERCLKMEYRVAARFLQHSEFYEGIRSAIISKDRQAQWNPENLEEVSDEYVASFYAPLDDELMFRDSADDMEAVNESW